MESSFTDSHMEVLTEEAYPIDESDCGRTSRNDSTFIFDNESRHLGDTPFTQITEKICKPDLAIYCKKCEEYIDAKILSEHRSLHRALDLFRYSFSTIPNSVYRLLQRRNTLIKQINKDKNRRRKNTGVESETRVIDGGDMHAQIKEINKCYEFLKSLIEETYEQYRQVVDVTDTKVTTQLSNSSNKFIQVVATCTSANERWKNQMEDRNVFQDSFGDNDNKSYFAVCDGHHGPFAADLCARELHRLLLVEMAKFDGRVVAPPVEAARQYNLNCPPRPHTTGSQRRRLFRQSVDIVEMIQFHCEQKFERFLDLRSREQTEVSLVEGAGNDEGDNGHIKGDELIKGDNELLKKDNDLMKGDNESVNRDVSIKGDNESIRGDHETGNKYVYNMDYDNDSRNRNKGRVGVEIEKNESLDRGIIMKNVKSYNRSNTTRRTDSNILVTSDNTDMIVRGSNIHANATGHDSVRVNEIPGDKEDESLNELASSLMDERLSRLTSARERKMLDTGVPDEKIPYCKNMADAFNKVYHLLDILLEYGTGEASRVRWSGTSVATMVLEDLGCQSDTGGCARVFGLHGAEEVGSTKGANSCALLHLANTGNVHAMLISNNTPRLLTRDHTCRNNKERRRIKTCGGTLSMSNVDCRINGILATTRGLGNHGDLPLKRCVIPDPYTTVVPISDQDQILVLASNGLWEVFDEHEVAAIVLKILPCNHVPHPERIHSSIRDLFSCKSRQISATSSKVTKMGNNPRGRFGKNSLANSHDGSGTVRNAEQVASRIVRKQSIASDVTMSADSRRNYVAKWMVEDLVEAALLAGAKDNITVTIALLSGCDV